MLVILYLYSFVDSQVSTNAIYLDPVVTCVCNQDATAKVDVGAVRRRQTRKLRRIG